MNDNAAYSSLATAKQVARVAMMAQKLGLLPPPLLSRGSANAWINSHQSAYARGASYEYAFDDDADCAPDKHTGRGL